MNNKNQNNLKREEIKPQKKWTVFCRWTSLRLFGEAKILKASYFSLLSVPVLAQFSEKLGVTGFPLYLKLLFFSSLFISFGNVLYSIFCPKVIKRFDAPNDMYRANLEIYEKRKKAEIQDKFSGDYEHCLAGFVRNNYKFVVARLICFLLMLFGGICLVLFLIERGKWVYSAQ